MEKAPEKQPLTTDDYIEIAGMYFTLEAQVNAVMARAAALQDHLHGRMHRAWMEPNGTDAFCTPLAEAYAHLGRAKSCILASHTYGSRVATALNIIPKPDVEALGDGDPPPPSGGGCKTPAP